MILLCCFVFFGPGHKVQVWYYVLKGERELFCFIEPKGVKIMMKNEVVSGLVGSFPKLFAFTGSLTIQFPPSVSFIMMTDIYSCRTDSKWSPTVKPAGGGNCLIAKPPHLVQAVGRMFDSWASTPEQLHLIWLDAPDRTEARDTCSNCTWDSQFLIQHQNYDGF